jgi:hypothetical protein
MTPRVLFGLALLVLAAAIAYAGFGRPWSFTRENRTYDGQFFKLDVKLSYKGEPHPISFVVGCKVHGVKYADGSTTRDVGLIPNVYGHRMKDGQAVVVRPPDACDGETSANGEVPPSFMPIIIVYDNADTLDFGKAYISDDAYDGPLAELKFDSAVITASDRAAWEEFRANGPKNVVTREQWWSRAPPDVIAAQGLKQVFPVIGETCHFAIRRQVPDEVKPLLRASPSFRFDGPWSPKRDQEGDLLFDKFRNEMKMEVAFWPTDLGVAAERKNGGFGWATPDYGVVRRDGNPGLAKIGSFRQNLPPITAYPVSSMVASGNWPSNPTLWPAKAISLQNGLRTTIHVEGGKQRGFAYCWNRAGFDPRITGQPDPYPAYDAVDRQRVHTIPPLHKDGWVPLSPFYVFESNKFLLQSNWEIVLSSFGGDI